MVEAFPVLPGVVAEDVAFDVVDFAGVVDFVADWSAGFAAGVVASAAGVADFAVDSAAFAVDAAVLVADFDSVDSDFGVADFPSAAVDSVADSGFADFAAPDYHCVSCFGQNCLIAASYYSVAHLAFGQADWPDCFYR